MSSKDPKPPGFHSWPRERQQNEFWGVRNAAKDAEREARTKEEREQNGYQQNGRRKRGYRGYRGNQWGPGE